jgi:hypothetical protein
MPHVQHIFILLKCKSVCCSFVSLRSLDNTHHCTRSSDVWHLNAVLPQAFYTHINVIRLPFVYVLNKVYFRNVWRDYSLWVLILLVWILSNAVENFQTSWSRPLFYFRHLNIWCLWWCCLGFFSANSWDRCSAALRAMLYCVGLYEVLLGTELPACLVHCFIGD